LKEIIKDLKGVYVTNFEFDQPNQCSRVDVEAIRARLAASGWSRVMENWNKRAGEARWRKKLAFPQSTKNGIKKLSPEEPGYGISLDHSCSCKKPFTFQALGQRCVRFLIKAATSNWPLAKSVARVFPALRMVMALRRHAMTGLRELSERSSALARRGAVIKGSSAVLEGTRRPVYLK